MESCRRFPPKMLRALTQQTLRREEGARSKESADLLARRAVQLNCLCSTTALIPTPTQAQTTAPTTASTPAPTPAVALDQMPAPTTDASSASDCGEALTGETVSFPGNGPLFTSNQALGAG